MPVIHKPRLACDEKHLQNFIDFSRWEIATGGPDPHIKLAVHLASASDDPYWYAAGYTAPYVIATNHAVTTEFSRERAQKDPEALRNFVMNGWEYLPVRKERRVNGTGPAKLAEIYTGLAHWLNQGKLQDLVTMPYPESFAKLDPPHFGRYFKTKLYETIRLTQARLGEPELVEMADIVPKGGSHPRGGLRMIYPGHDHKSDKPYDLSQANELSGQLKLALEDQGLEASWFVVEVLLCNYRQAVKRGQYPGRAHDSELGHYYVTAQRYNVGRVLAARRALFNKTVLGESGKRWNGRRIELGKAMTDYGYVWSDFLYDYNKTTELRNPVKR